MEQLSRIRTLDLIRGIAVLGILTVNVGSFAGPTSGLYSPNLPHAGNTLDNWAFAFRLVFLEGKMRALFSILFGASLLLFVERREAVGRDGEGLQLRRLLWLALFGYLHFALFWDGDILFLYACVGVGALILRRAQPKAMIVVALATVTLWQAWGAATWVPSVSREARVMAGTATPGETAEHHRIIADYRAEDQADAAATLSGFTSEVRSRLFARPDYPLTMVAYNWGEALSYMLIGMALLRSGFFSGAWHAVPLRALALGGAAAGLTLTLAFAAWAHPRGYPELAMHMALGYGLGIPHLLTALGYLALLVMAAPRLLASRLGLRLEAAGKAAFTNYLGSTLLMCALFSGWGLGLFGQFSTVQQIPFVLLAWAVMLVWSQPWLARFSHGPLEWLWRCLAEWRVKSLLR